MYAGGKQDLGPKYARLGVIHSYSFPSLHTASLNNVSDSVLIHLFEFFGALGVEFLVFDLCLLKVCLTQVSVSELKRKQLVLLIEGN